MTVGNDLRARRMELGIDLKEIAGYLRIQPSYLDAIEAEDFRELPGGAYTIGFVKTYARALGLDQETIANAFRREQAGAMQVAPLRIHTQMAESRVPTIPLVAAALLVAAAAWIGWAYVGSRGHTSPVTETVPAVPDRLVPAAPASPVVPATEAGASEAVQAGAAVTPAPAGSASPLQPATSAVPGIPASMPFTPPGGGDADEARNDTDQPVQSAGVRTAPVNQDTGAGSVLGSAANVSRAEIHTSEDSWIQIHDAAHTAIYTGVMHAGDVYKLPNAPGYTFTTGNAGAVTLVVDGVAGQALGSPGQVLRNVAVPVKK